jgi:hypothetical protein
MDFILVVASLASVVLAVVWIKQLLGARSSLPLPPSPKGLPVLGNLLDLAGDDVHVKCRDWSRQFGILLPLGNCFPRSPVYHFRLQVTILSLLMF